MRRKKMIYEKMNEEQTKKAEKFKALLTCGCGRRSEWRWEGDNARWKRGRETGKWCRSNVGAGPRWLSKATTSPSSASESRGNGGCLIFHFYCTSGARRVRPSRSRRCLIATPRCEQLEYRFYCPPRAIREVIRQALSCEVTFVGVYSLGKWIFLQFIT